MRAINTVCQWTMLMRTAKRARGLKERQMQLHARWKNRWKGESVARPPARRFQIVQELRHM